MALSREQLLKLDEDTLRRDVLIPLLRRMGYKDVVHEHGGILEQGKDLVMWRPEDFGARTNLAFVVKATRVSGKASGKGSAGEASTQIQQAFGATFLDSVTGEEQRVHRCWLVSSAEITKEARSSIGTMLKNSNLDRMLNYIDGERLWSLLQEFSPEATVVDDLTRISK